MVRWTARAKSQLRSIHNYISQDSPLYAKRVSEQLVQKTLGLSELPYRGHKVSELNDDSVRELTLYSYRIIYEIKSNNQIIVLAIIHRRRQIEPDEITQVK